MSNNSHEVQITERDLALLRDLFESRVMTLAHAAALHFSGSREAAKKRVQRLKDARYIGERLRFRPYDPSILFLLRRGFEALRRAGGLADYPAMGWESMERRTHVSPFTLQHELDILSTKAALTTALRAHPHHQLVQFSTWPKLFDFKTRQKTPDGYHRSMTMKPDAFFRTHVTNGGTETQDTSFFFLELDRSTETQQNLRNRAVAYLDFYRNGGFAARHGQSAERFRQFPFRVMWIFRNEERRNNAAESFLRHHPPVLTMAWLTTFAQMLKNPLDDIWIRPLDYQRAVRNTPFDPIGHSPLDYYRRQSVREAFVAARITRHSLFQEKSDPSLDRL